MCASSSPIRRRDFLKWGTFTGACLMVGMSRNRLVTPHAGRITRRFAPNQWIAIDEAGDVTIVAAHSEMGQGIRTTTPMIVAEELGADWSRVRVIHARPGPDFTGMRTSGSGSTVRAWRALRPAAAAAREMLVAAAASTWGVPTDTCIAEGGMVTHAPTGRQLAFGAVVARAAGLPVPRSPALKSPSDFRLLGTRVKRVDGNAIVEGRAQYGIDVRIPNARVAAIARSPRVGGRVRRVDAARARAIPGVEKVVEVPTGVAVIADSTWTAFRARDALVIEWDDSHALPDGTEQHMARLEAALFNGKVARREGGDVDQALAGAARRLEQTYHYPFQAHAAMEPLNCTVDLHANRCEIWVGTQAPNEVQTEVAKLLDYKPEQVIVNVQLLGGGFGRRLAIDYAIEAVEVARAAQVPVQVVWSREDDMRHALYHPGQVTRLTAGLDARRRIVAMRHRAAAFNLTMFGDYDPNYDPVADGAPWGGIDQPYAYPALDVTLALLAAPVPTGAWRAVGYPATVFARESFLDEIAQESGQDPLELRLSLLPSPGNTEIRGIVFPNGDRLRRVLQVCADRAGWSQPFPRVRDGRRWGRGIACNSYHRQTMVAQIAEVSVGDAGDVRAHRVVTAIDCGLAVNPLGIEGQVESGVIWALSAALKTQITFENGQAVQSNYTDFPVMRMREAPVIDTHIVPSGLLPLGVGEQPVPAVAPAVANAIFAATRVRVRRLPVRASELARSR